MMADTMDALGLAGKYVVRVNNRKVLDGVMQAIGVTDEAQKLTVLRAIDKLDKFGPEGVALLLGKGRKDESGDFTEGAGLDEAQINVIGRLTAPNRPDMVLSSENPESDASIERIGRPRERQNWWNLDWWSHDLDYFLRANGFQTPDSVFEAFDRLFEIEELLWSCGYNADRVKIDLSVVRGLEYYTGPVFEIELTFKVQNEKGQDVVFGSVGGGGRYDGLVSRFRNEETPATGFSIGVSRLASALRLTGNLSSARTMGPVVVTVMEKERVADYQQMVAELRAAGIRAEMFLGSSKNLGKQMKYADKRNAPAVIIQGSDERDQGVVQVKDLAEGAEAAAAITDNAAWKMERPGQYTVPRGELVEFVKTIPAVAEWLRARG